MLTDHSFEDASSGSHLEQCHAFIIQQLKQRSRPAAKIEEPPPGPAVTISHQTGSGAHEIASRLARLLNESEPKSPVKWTVFDRNLVEKVLEEHHLPGEMAKFMTEDRRSLIKDVMEELVGLRPPSWVMAPKIAETVLHLAEAGHAVLVGRGAGLITARMPNVFHVRLIASVPGRIARIQKLNNLTPKEAAQFIKIQDHARGRYAKTHFHASGEDDLLYHLVINTDLIPCPDAARIIADAARSSFHEVSVFHQPMSPLHFHP